MISDVIDCVASIRAHPCEGLSELLASTNASSKCAILAIERWDVRQGVILFSADYRLRRVEQKRNSERECASVCVCACVYVS